ncbi:heat shock protein HtpX [Methylophilales bacterium MBRSG12]|uniref:Protease HtpX homolog n=1 Tax=Methylophilales bacterium MBRS-H7 TaxID=1623450 RepID=A0A0H4J393_9PROT|nr:heat shock protein HtpX [Methylophilales bacterium MBRSF5]AKO66233.1 heat shock protein HtpX [Methylophilales bacterium MBRS-H7]AKO67551.1 heat shock protein HtpX [Methylophilales bacterium MBRSG12]
MNRIIIFMLTNLAIVFVLSITMSLFGFKGYLDENGINYQGLLIFAACFGFGGAFISLAISKWTAKRMSRARVITQAQSETEKWLIDTVASQAQRAGIGMPEVAIFPSPQLNAFATGMNKNNALVAVSQGLLDNMSKDEVEAVLAHEVSHVANGDMVTLTLIQGVVNTFVMFLSRVIGYTVDKVIFKTRNGVGPGFYITMIVAEIILGILASMIVMWFSRQREFRADYGGAALTDKHKMIAALLRLKSYYQPSDLPNQMSALGVSGTKHAGFMRFFSSHPPLEERIEYLQNLNELN